MTLALILSVILASTLSADSPSGARLMRQPDISRDRIVFIYAGDLWTAARGGGPAHRLTTTAEAGSFPKFSPDGKSIAFTRNRDIYVIPAEGGEERRLTWHPLNGRVAGWATDGRKLFVPEYGSYMHGAAEWSPENLGVEPDYIVPLKLFELSGGHDPQLEKAIELATEALKTYRTKIPNPPPYKPAQ